MAKSKVFLIFITTFFLFLYSSNVTLAVEAVVERNVYPDYSYEFLGKDKCEKFNRKLFVFNLKLNKYLLRPANIVWASIVPQYGMDRLQNAYTNINFPVRALSCLLQKDYHASKQELVSFLTNTTLGVGGLYTPAQTRFNIETHQEDMGQALAHFKAKPGPYLVLPVVRGNIRDLVGQLLDCPLRPTSYVGPFGAAANAMFALNNSTYMQPVFKRLDDDYPDPYSIAKQIDGIERYIKNANLDRPEVLLEKTVSQNLVKVSKFSENSEIGAEIKPDIELTNFNSQGSLVDSTRTAFFDNQKLDSSMWSNMSVWNKTFGKRIKTAFVSVNANRPNYKYRYILQKNKNAPIAILYPSIGEGSLSDKSVALAKILYDEGYSIMIQGSSFNWEFIKSMPRGYKPGMPYPDAEYLRLTTAKIINSLEKNNGCKFDRKILVGCSFGALTGLFVAAQEENNDTIGISNYIAVNPPIKMMFALKQLDKYAQDWENDPSDVKLRTAIVAEKIMNVSHNIYHKNIQEMPESMPFTEDEAKQVIGFIMKQKLSDVVFAIEDYSRGKTNNLCESICKMSFYDYAQKYLFVDLNETPEQIGYETSLYSLADFLKRSKKYKIYHTIDDYFVNSEQLAWLKRQTKDNSVFFSNGSHLGCMYRKEFVEAFKEDTKLTKAVKNEEETIFANAQ